MKMVGFILFSYLGDEDGVTMRDEGSEGRLEGIDHIGPAVE